MNIALTTAQIQQAVNSLLAYALPWLGVVLPGFLKRDGLGAKGNAIISGIIILSVSAAQAYGAGNLGLNPVADFLAVSGGLTALLNGPLKPLDQWLQSNLGVGVGDTKLKIPAVSLTSPAPQTSIASASSSSASTSASEPSSAMSSNNAAPLSSQPQHPWV